VSKSEPSIYPKGGCFSLGLAKHLQNMLMGGKNRSTSEIGAGGKSGSIVVERATAAVIHALCRAALLHSS
jgi:hypothetical protein